MISFALIGQPNCGKSTLFNQVAGYKADTGNFSGTTVTYTESKVKISGKVISLVDLPGTYTLAGTNPAEREVFNYLSTHSVDLIITVIDASRLSHGLELVIEVLELEQPVILALNMMDEARRLGIEVDIPELEKQLGVPVMPLVASKGQGVKQLFTKAMLQVEQGLLASRLIYSKDLETYISEISKIIREADHSLKSEAIAIKLLENDPFYTEKYGNKPEISRTINNYLETIEKNRGQKARWAISGERHAISSQIAQTVSFQGKINVSWRDKLDDVLLDPVWGYFFLILVLYLFFQSVYHFGSFLEGPLLSVFEMLENQITILLGQGTLFSELAKGLVQGIAGGAAIVLPYLIPFLLGLGLLEDIGYLPRVAFLMDTLMHQIGLHGKAIVPFILGYGCNVPAIMSTRILEEPRDRFLSAALSTMIPCAARLSVVFGMVAFYLGPNLALAIYLFNILVIAITAKILTKMTPKDSPGLILEMPVYRIPTLRTLSSKVWFRIREFIIDAWPVLIIGSIFLALINYLHWTEFFNLVFYPISWLLGLPKEVGVPLIFGILRKELSLIMLRQALNAQNLSIVLTSVQMITFSVFVVFYVPCLATLVVLKKELGTKNMLLITLMTLIIATLGALFARGISMIFL